MKQNRNDQTLTQAEPSRYTQMLFFEAVTNRNFYPHVKTELEDTNL